MTLGPKSATVVKDDGVIYKRKFTNTTGSLVALFNFRSIFFSKYIGFTTAVVKVPCMPCYEMYKIIIY